MSSSDDHDHRARRFDPRVWDRAGQGSELQFYATDEDVFLALAQLSVEFPGLQMVMVERGFARGVASWERAQLPLPDWVRAWASGTARENLNHWIHVPGVTPIVDVPGADVPRWCSINGLTLLQHGSSYKGRRRESRISIVSNLVNRLTGAKAQLKERRRVYARLRALIRKQLAFCSVQVRPDGVAMESDRVLMTAAAAELARDGGFDRGCGRPVGA